MKIYVVYVLSDYAHALAVTTNYNAAKKYEEMIKNRTNRPTWIDEIKVTEEITELDCD